MRNQKQTIRKIINVLNNRDEGGGFWLPNIQRHFVWSEDQICRLFNSIMREYPISTLLVWKTTNKIRRRKFIDNWKASLRLSDFYVPEDISQKCLVLDGQQRLQSLFIGLSGSYDERELYFDVLSSQTSAPDDIRYKFKFMSASQGIFPWTKFKELIFTTKRINKVRDQIASRAGRTLSASELEKIEDHLQTIERTFKMDEAIAYQELDSVDNPDLYKEDDVVEIFIRANSGGTKLGKSDLLFSLLIASWEVAEEKIEELLQSLNRTGFAFDRDFVLKTCLVLLNQGARYEVTKFRKEGVRESIEKKWPQIASAISDVLDFVTGKTYIRCDKAIPSYLALIPLVYFRFHYPAEWRSGKDYDSYLLRCLVAGAFGGQSDNLLDAIIKRIDEIKSFVASDVFEIVKSQGRSLELTDNRLFEMGYGSKTIHLLFNIWYREFNVVPLYVNNFPEIDHIFPQSALKQEKILNPETGRPVMKYRDGERNQLANCMMLRKLENGPGGKGSTLPEEWFESKDSAYFNEHLIPDDRTLLHMDRFEDFIEARKKLIRGKFADLLAK